MKGVVETIGGTDNPVSSLVTTRSGQVIDLQNLPGHKKLQLIRDGEMEMDQFIAPVSMTGIKLKKLRDAHRLQMEAVMNPPTTTKELQVGEFILYKEKSYEILKTREDAVQIDYVLANGKHKKAWVQKDKVEKG